jgi:hypothetical protein
MHLVLLLILTSLGCSERVLIQGKIPQGRAWTSWKSLLSDASTEEGLDYELIDQNRFLLEAYLKWAGEHGPGTDRLKESQEDLAMAFLINAYNAAAIYSVIEHQPENSILEIEAGFAPWEGGGFYWGQRFRIDGEWVNLYYLEEQYIINRYQSPLPHVALNPAIAGAPQVKWWLPDEWDKKGKKGSGLDLHLRRSWRSWLSSDAGMAETETGWALNGLIFEWEEDILSWSHAENLCGWLTDFTKGDRKIWLQSQGEDCAPERMEIDWSLNLAPADEG